MRGEPTDEKHRIDVVGAELGVVEQPGARLDATAPAHLRKNLGELASRSWRGRISSACSPALVRMNLLHLARTASRSDRIVFDLLGARSAQPGISTASSRGR